MTAMIQTSCAAGLLHSTSIYHRKQFRFCPSLRLFPRPRRHRSNLAKLWMGPSLLLGRVERRLTHITQHGSTSCAKKKKPLSKPHMKNEEHKEVESNLFASSICIDIVIRKLFISPAAVTNVCASLDQASLLPPLRAARLPWQNVAAKTALLFQPRKAAHGVSIIPFRVIERKNQIPQLPPPLRLASMARYAAMIRCVGVCERGIWSSNKPLGVRSLKPFLSVQNLPNVSRPECLMPEACSAPTSEPALFLGSAVAHGSFRYSQ